MIKILDICSGIGGFSLGLESTGGFDTVAFCEFDDFCRKVLNKHWPDVPIYKDLKEIGNEPERIIQDFDLICGGIPCQPFSVAGKKKGKEDDRHLWPYMYEIIKHKKPSWVIVENVGGFVNVALDDVCLDLEAQGYATQSFIIPACSVEAPHRRDRIWILGKFMGNASSDGRIESESSEKKGGSIRRSEEGRMLESEGASDMENPGRALRQGRIEQGEKADEVGQGDADQLERSGGTSRSDVANSQLKGLEGQHGNSSSQRGQNEGSLSGTEGSSRTDEDVPNSSGQRLEGHRGEHGLREASEEEQTSRSSQEQDVSHAKELDRNVDDNGHSGQGDGQQRQGLQGELGGASSNRGEHVADAKRNEHIGEVGGGLGEEGEDAQQERQEDSTSGISSRTGAVRLSDNGHATGEDVANTERLGQQGQGEHERPSNTAKASEGQASGTDDGSQGQTGQGHIEPGVGGMADGISARLDGHLGFEREPNIPRVATGIPERVNRLKALGNSIVPQVIYNIGLAILEEEERTNVAD